MSIELVVFDMAGTTVRDDDAVNLSLREALAAHINVDRAAVNRVMGWPKPIAIRTLLEQNLTKGKPASPELVDSVHSDFVERMIRFYQTDAQVEPMPYALDVFQELHATGVRVALDTGFSRRIVNAILDRLGWQVGGFLDATVASDEVPKGRPDPDLVFKAMALTGIASAACVAKVGDTPSDLQEGANAGCALVIGVTNGTHSRETLEPYPHTHLLANLRELPRILAEASPTA